MVKANETSKKTKRKYKKREKKAEIKEDPEDWLKLIDPQVEVKRTIQAIFSSLMHEITNSEMCIDDDSCTMCSSFVSGKIKANLEALTMKQLGEFEEQADLLSQELEQLSTTRKNKALLTNSK